MMKENHKYGKAVERIEVDLIQFKETRSFNLTTRDLVKGLPSFFKFNFS